MRVLQAAVLHDTVEDTHTTIGQSSSHLELSGGMVGWSMKRRMVADGIEELIDAFGLDVARIVQVCLHTLLSRLAAGSHEESVVLTGLQECTDPPGLTGNEAKREQVRTAPKKSREAQQVKLAE